MTTPGGVPNLPAGALTLDTLASKVQDMSGTAMKARAVQRFPSIMNVSTGLDPSLDITPFGILTRIWSEVNSLVATSDPADVQGPEDLPPLVLQFIEGLPVIGQFVGLLEAIIGTYTGDDANLLTIQQLFAPIRQVVQLVSGIGGTGGIPTADQVTLGWQNLLNSFVSALTGTPSAAPTPGVVGDALAAQTAALAAIAAQVNALTQQNTAVSTGAALAIDEFTRTGVDLGANWDVEVVNDFGTSFTVKTDGTQAVPAPSGLGNARAIARFQGTNHTAASDTTETAIVLGTPISNGAPAPAAVDIHGRMNTARTTSIRARIQAQGTSNLLQLHSRVSGVETLIGQQLLTAQPGAGTIAKLICGTAVSSRQFVVKLGAEVYTFTEVGTGSQLGSGFRERGMGWVSSGSFFGQSQPGAVAHWTSIDVGAPVGVSGSADTVDGGTAATAPEDMVDGATAATPATDIYDGGTA